METLQCVIGGAGECYGENDQARFSIVTGLQLWNTQFGKYIHIGRLVYRM